MHLKHLLAIFLLIIFFNDTYCQRRDKFKSGIEFQFGPSLFAYDKASNRFLKNSVYTSTQGLLFYRNFYLGGGLEFNYSHIKDILLFDHQFLVPNDKININYGILNFGYKHYLSRNLSIDPHIGIVKSNLKDKDFKPLINTQTGYNFGLSVVRYLNFYGSQWIVFLKNDFNISNLRSGNSNLGRSFYSFEFGVGGRWGEPWN